MAFKMKHNVFDIDKTSQGIYNMHAKCASKFTYDLKKNKGLANLNETLSTMTLVSATQRLSFFYV